MFKKLLFACLLAISACDYDCPPNLHSNVYYQDPRTATCFEHSQETSCGYRWNVSLSAVPCNEVPGFESDEETAKFLSRLIYARRTDGSCGAFYQPHESSAAIWIAIDCYKVQAVIDK